MRSASITPCWSATRWARSWRWPAPRERRKGRADRDAGRGARHAGAPGAARGGGKARATRPADDLRLGLRPGRPLRRPSLARQLDAGPRARAARPSVGPRLRTDLAPATPMQAASTMRPGSTARRWSWRRARPHDARQARCEARRSDHRRQVCLAAPLRPYDDGRATGRHAQRARRVPEREPEEG